MNWKEIKEKYPKSFKLFYEWSYNQYDRVFIKEENFAYTSVRNLYDFFDSNSIMVIIKYLKGRFKYYIVDFNEDLVEKWQDIKGYEKLYEISNRGRIRSLERQVKFGTGNRVSPSIILQPAKDMQGYLFVYLSKNSKTKRRDLHREVARAFLPDFDEGLEVNHLNGLKDDNWVTNLEMVTASGNQKHAQKLHLHNGNKQAGFESRTLAEEQAFLKAFEILENKFKEK